MKIEIDNSEREKLFIALKELYLKEAAFINEVECGDPNDKQFLNTRRIDHVQTRILMEKFMR